MRRYRPNRLIQLDGADELVDYVTNVTQEMLRDVDVEWVGDLYDPEAGEVTELWGTPQVRVVIPGPCMPRPRLSQYNLVPEGYFDLGNQQMTLVMGPCNRVEDWLSEDLARYNVESVLLHELTHASDIALSRRRAWLLAALEGVAEERERAEEDLADRRRQREGLALRDPRALRNYVNEPHEVKAYGRDVFREVRRHFEKSLNVPEYREHITRRHRPGPYLQQVIMATTVMKNLIRLGLTEGNQRKIIRDVYQELGQTGLLEDLEAMWD